MSSPQKQNMELEVAERSSSTPASELMVTTIDDQGNIVPEMPTSPGLYGQITHSSVSSDHDDGSDDDPSHTFNPTEDIDNNIAQPLEAHGTAGIEQFARTQTSGQLAVPSPTSHSSSWKRASTSSHHATSALNSLQSYLCVVPHLCTLPLEDIAGLHLMVRQYAPLDLVCDKNQALQHVYVLAKGTVEVFNPKSKSGIGHKRVGTITAPNVFGVDSAVLDRPCRYIMRAGAQSDLLLIPKDEFLALIKKNATFAMSVGHKLVEQIDIFSVFHEFCRSIFAVSSAVDKQKMADGYTLSMPEILENYMRINTLIHPQRDLPTLDIGAWSYALDRLPHNITETFVLNLVRSLPPFLAKELRSNLDEEFGVNRKNSSFVSSYSGTGPVTFVPTKARRRCTWKVGDRGHTIVLLREGFTDVIDLVTCFCIHMVEARKLRQRLQSIVAPSAVDILSEAIAMVTDETNQKQILDAERFALSRLPLSEAEKAGLLIMWPRSLLRKVLNILMHREEVVVKIDTSISKRFDDDPYLRWAISLRSHVHSEPGQQIAIDILSSNTHTTKNLLCSFATGHKDEILAWAREHESEIAHSEWTNESDKLYYLFGAMVASDEVMRERYRKALHDSGFLIMEETSMTGLQVDIIDVDRLNPQLLDDALGTAFAKLKKSPPSSTASANKSAESQPRKHYILNMNFAFGAQADGIMRALILTFGHQIRSINVVGKAAALQGRRGDVQLPTRLVFSKAALGEDSTDEMHTVQQGISASRLRKLLPDRDIHIGSIMTSPGTLLHNHTILKFYKEIHGCVGVEMEGCYFARQVEESSNLGLVRKDLVTRYAYYTHDLPTDPNHTYRPLEPREGVPPLYAIVRCMIDAMFEDLDKE